LHETNVTGKTAAWFSKYPKLEVLSLRRNRIDDETVAELAKSTTLTNLDLADTPITDACIEHLKKMRGLTSVYLSDTKISAGGKHRVWEILEDKDVPWPDEEAKSSESEPTLE
jgi:Leucine-rich repeat (LRR) protein